MGKLIRVFVTGIVVSFIGALPLGTINIAAMQLTITDGLQAGILFALGMILPDLFYVMATLLAMQWIQKRKGLFKALEWVTLLLVLALAAANFYAALHPGVHKNVLLSSTLPPFFLGFVMNGVNPLQIPFWFGWNSVLFSKKVLEPRWKHYLLYAAGVAVGLFAGTAVFIFGGRLAADRISSHQPIFYGLIGCIFAATAIFQVWKMRRNKDIAHQLEHPEEIQPGLPTLLDPMPSPVKKN